VHRVANFHRERLVGKKFVAISPNGRFTDGAELINGKPFSRIEAVGKNLFAFFGEEDEDNDEQVVVVHIHFGMAGNWAVYDTSKEDVPDPTPTNRLRLQCPGIVADLSAMTVKHGGMTLYNEKRSKLGEDPLRNDSNPQRLWERVSKSKKSIGALIMDQGFFTGPGNIYRAEILFKAGVHPNKLGKQLTREEFDSVWYHTVSLLERGFVTGSILTVDREEAKALGKPNLRRYIYNTSKCPRCKTSIQTWQINSRTCYACTRCQPLQSSSSTTETSPNVAVPVTPPRDCVPFNSHCAREKTQDRLEQNPNLLTVKELKAELTKLGEEYPSKVKKGELVELLLRTTTTRGKKKLVIPSSSEEAAAEKAAAGESLAVEHIAELAPSQARKARSKATTKGGIQRKTGSMKLTIPQIKEKLDEMGVVYTSKMKKSHLFDLLKRVGEAKTEELNAVVKTEHSEMKKDVNKANGKNDHEHEDDTVSHQSNDQSSTEREENVKSTPVKVKQEFSQGIVKSNSKRKKNNENTTMNSQVELSPNGRKRRRITPVTPETM